MEVVDIVKPEVIEHDYLALNAKTRTVDEFGNFNTHFEAQAVRAYFLEHVNKNMVFFHSLKERLDYLLEEGYYDKDLFSLYTLEQVQEVTDRAYSHKFRFKVFLGALKFFKAYALRTKDQTRYLERFEDRVVCCALLLAEGSVERALTYVDDIITGRNQPATPTFSNAGKNNYGELVSCFRGDTKVMVASNRYKAIKDVVVGDTVLSASGKFRKVLAVRETTANMPDMVKLTVKVNSLHTPFNGEVFVTVNHPILTLWDGWVKAGDLQPGKSKVRTLAYHGASSFYGDVVSVEKVENHDPVYDLTVDQDETYYANGVAAHNCFLLSSDDNMKGISRIWSDAADLSKIGGGVGICLTDVREDGAPIRSVEDRASGVAPIAKILEDLFSYVDQLGTRPGAGAVWINILHMDSPTLLDAKRENVDEKIRLKTLNIGFVVPDVFMEHVRKGKDIYLFSTYDIRKVYGLRMSKISLTEYYDEFARNPLIRKKKVNARDYFQSIAGVQMESGYPFLMFEDTVNRANNIFGYISHSNICSEILQISEHSRFNRDGTYAYVGRDISCNLSSLNVYQTLYARDFGNMIARAVRMCTAVSDRSFIKEVPSIVRGNQASHSIGIGAMNLHGTFSALGMEYGGKDSLSFTDLYFMTVRYYCLLESNAIAIERKQTFHDFKRSRYATGEALEYYLDRDYTKVIPQHIQKVMTQFGGVVIPTPLMWAELNASIMEHGLYHAYLMAVAPTGSISYINNATASVHPVSARIEERQEGKIHGYYPAPHMTTENVHLYQDAFELGPYRIIDVYAEAQKHVDQGMSLTLFFQEENTTTRDINKVQFYAWRKGIKTLYYIRARQKSLTNRDAVAPVVYEACSV